MKEYNRKTIFSEIEKWCILSKKDDYIEVTEWANGEGFDVDIYSTIPARFSMTRGVFKLLKKMVKKLQ